MGFTFSNMLYITNRESITDSSSVHSLSPDNAGKAKDKETA